MNQVSQQVQDLVSGKFLPGRSANPSGRPSRAERQARIDAKARELAEAFGGWDRLTVLDRVRIEQAAVLLAGRPKGHEDRVRYANTLDRLLGAVERRRGARRHSEDRPIVGRHRVGELIERARDVR